MAVNLFTVTIEVSDKCIRWLIQNETKHMNYNQNKVNIQTELDNKEINFID